MGTRTWLGERPTPPESVIAAPELEAFIVDRIRHIGHDPALLQETLRAVAEEKEHERGQLEQERRMLQAEHQSCRGEARKLTAALATSASTSVAERVAELDHRTVQIETRLGEIQRTIAGIDSGIVDPGEAAWALAAFDPVWDALVPRERVSLLQLLIERVDYDGAAKECAITFRPAGLASLGADAKRAA